MELVFSVEDSGIGIHEEERESIFGAFEQQKGQTQAKYGGTGLGLAITKRLVEMMGGQITVSGQEGTGSIFQVTLKEITISSTDDFKEPTENLIDVDEILFHHATILLVDDIETNRNLVKGYLEKYDFTLFEAVNGKEAIESSQSYQPDLILMDMRPVGGLKEIDQLKIFLSSL